MQTAYEIAQECEIRAGLFLGVMRESHAERYEAAKRVTEKYVTLGHLWVDIADKLKWRTKP